MLVIGAGLVMIFVPKGDNQVVDVGERRFSASPPAVLIGVGLVLMTPNAYSQSVSTNTVTITLKFGYGLCDIRAFSNPARIGGPDDETLIALRSLVKIPSSDDAKLARWGTLIAKLLKRDPEVLEALQAAIVRSNYTSATLIEYCNARAKPVDQLSRYETALVGKIHSEIGFAP